MLSCLLSLSHSFVCIFCPRVCVLCIHMRPFAGLRCLCISTCDYLVPCSTTRFIWRQKGRPWHLCFFTYGNSLSPTRLPTISYLVSHGLLCTSVRMQDGVRHLWEMSEGEEKQQLCEVGGIISGFWSDASQSLIYFLHRGDGR